MQAPQLTKDRGEERRDDRATDTGVKDPLPHSQSFSSRLRQSALSYYAAAGLGLGALMESGKAGGLFTNGTTDQQMRDFAAGFAPGSALSLRVYSPLYTGNPPGQANRSATYYNSRYVFTVKHTFDEVASQLTGLEVADGPHYNNNRGNVGTVSRIIPHPTLDFVILELSQPFIAGPSRVIGTAAVGDITYNAGYGSWGTPATGLSPRDGFVRGFDARVTDLIQSPYLPPFHQTTLFGTGNLVGLQRNARAAGGDSGGPVEAGPPIHSGKRALVGVLVGATTVVSPSGGTSYVYLGEPSLKAWIEANTQLPKPTIDVSRAANGDVVASWTAANMEWGWVLQCSNDLQSWSDLGGLRTTAGSYTCSGISQQFFRFRPY